MSKMLQNKIVLITGGTGSLGKVLVRRILSGEVGVPKKIIVFSRDEAKQHEMRLAYLCKKVTTDEVIYNNFVNLLQFRIGDVRNYADVCSALKDAEIVINAAALKQVPTCEYFPEQALETNCFGAVNIVRALREHDYPVETVVGISTDKAAKPINVMGMTKAIQERIFISANILNPKVRFVGVRYGNVLASRGSVIPAFHEQIASGGPVTITHNDMTRFLISINQAVDVIFAALRDANPGDIFIPIVPSSLVINIAKALIGKRDIKIKDVGIRPGEKMHEILISEEEMSLVVKRGNYYVIGSMLPELKTDLATNKILTKEYSSSDDVMNYDDTVKLLEKHKLLIGQTELAEGGELLV
jgi:FlaA1/EpsC-like NDP-sugar epimerase